MLGDRFSDPEAFEGVGSFWGVQTTLSHIRTRFTLVEALLKLRTRDAVHTALTQTMTMLRLSPSDKVGARLLVPSLLLRLDRDQECYNFLSWYNTTDEGRRYDWDTKGLSPLDSKEADIFELPKTWTEDDRHSDLGFLVDLALLKVRLLLDLRALQALPALTSGKLPQEIQDQVCEQLLAPHLDARKAFIETSDLSLLIEDITEQLGHIIRKVNQINHFLWSCFPSSESIPSLYPLQSDEDAAEAQKVLQYSYDAWIETPGAIEVMEQLLHKDCFRTKEAIPKV